MCTLAQMTNFIKSETIYFTKLESLQEAEFMIAKG